MNYCPSCKHDRLVHDSWGCKMGCGCGLSIIYIPTRANKRDKAEEEKAIAAGNAQAIESDRIAEEHVKSLLKRRTRASSPRDTIQ